ncbi:MAG: hypothetical protein IK101_06600 [Oscillospiraceae bacterium]|nr:hypothetical protein [Oscillospiraceae bacterium]
MPKLVKSEKVSLKSFPEVNESAIQEFIFNDPSVLGLGDLIPIQREKIQPAGGRLDILLSDSDGLARYEVEIQLGATDPSHIIRTIEYWDTEKKRYPKYDHCAVIVAEEITARFMNVISLFNGTIPLIALQMSAVKRGDDIELIFTKVLDRISLGSDDEDEAAEVTDRNYWEKRSTTAMMKMVDKIFADLSDLTDGYELKYNKFYVGIAKDGVAKNFMSFRPKKTFIYLCIKANESETRSTELEDAGVDASFVSRNRQYEIKIDNYGKYENLKSILSDMGSEAKKRYEGSYNE